MAEIEASKLIADVGSCQIDTHSVSDSNGMGGNVNQNERIKPQSYLIFDTETTGLQGVYGNPRITELCLLGVHREDLFEDGVKIPRVVNKLQLCVNPEKFITPGSSQITGLFNDALERQLSFNRDIFLIINMFIQAQAQPACLIAHNGNKFDYPLLVSELKRVGEKLPQGLLCADSLDALRELDANPEGQSSHVRGQSSHDVINHTLRDRGQSSNCEVNVKDTWNITEVTPVKRNLSSETDSSAVHKKPKKDVVNGSQVDIIHRGKVARKLDYIPPTSINEIGLTNTQTYSKSNTPNEIRKESKNNSSHGSEGINNQETASNKMAFSCKTNLSDEDLMAAVHHLETNRPSNIRPEDIAASEDIQSGMSDCDANQNHTQPLSKPECDLKTPAKSNTILSKQPLGSKPGGALPNGTVGCFQAIGSNKDSSPNGKFGHYIDESRSEKSANSQGTLPNSSFISVSASGSNKEFSPSTEPDLPEHGQVDGSISEKSTITNQTSTSSCDNQHPPLVSEKTVSYYMDPTHLPKTELSSQGSLLDDDFLIAVEEMETSGDKETTGGHETNFIPQASTSGFGRKSVNDTETGAGKQEDAESSTDMKISCEGNSTKQISVVRQQNQKCCEQISDNGQGCLLRANIQKSPFSGNTASTNGKRKSFRLPDIYKRHFGNLPSTSHTAEDDCRTLLKIVKKFSPKFLEWVDEHCVPFDSVKPMY